MNMTIEQHRLIDALCCLLTAHECTSDTPVDLVLHQQDYDLFMAVLTHGGRKLSIPAPVFGACDVLLDDSVAVPTLRTK